MRRPSRYRGAVGWQVMVTFLMLANVTAADARWILSWLVEISATFDADGIIPEQVNCWLLVA